MLIYRVKMNGMDIRTNGNEFFDEMACIHSARKQKNDNIAHINKRALCNKNT